MSERDRHVPAEKAEADPCAITVAASPYKETMSAFSLPLSLDPLFSSIHHLFHLFHSPIVPVFSKLNDGHPHREIRTLHPLLLASFATTPCIRKSHRRRSFLKVSNLICYILQQQLRFFDFNQIIWIPSLSKSGSSPRQGHPESRSFGEWCLCL